MNIRILFLIAFSLLTSIRLYAQTDIMPPPPADSNEDAVFTHVEQMPVFSGGEAALFEFISRNLTYPAREKEDGIQGTVYVQFVVDKNGNITLVEKKRGIKGGEMLDKEAVRMIKAMPKWNPGYQNNKAVNVQMILPVKFQIK